MKGVILAISCWNILHLGHHFYFSLSCEVSLLNIWPNGQKLTFQTILLEFLCPYIFEINTIKKAGVERWGGTLSSHLSNSSLIWHLYFLQSLVLEKVLSVKPLQSTLLFHNVLVLTFLCLFPRSDLLLNTPRPLCIPGLFSGDIRLADHTGLHGVYPTVHEVLSEAA